MLHSRPTSELTDEDLERELAHAHAKRHDTFLAGTAHALANHGERTAELEAAYVERFPERVAEAARKLSLYGPAAADTSAG